ncbi:MAG: hypothetical protein GC191_03150 [Azospirillum sp.]|nr:hypothetical protein [Azospirillum sp.]
MGDRMPTALSQLAPEGRHRAENNLLALVADIEAHAAALARSPNEDRKILASLLQYALDIPDRNLVYVLDDQPILVGWGMTASGPASSRQILRELVNEVREDRRRAQAAAKEAEERNAGPPPIGEPNTEQPTAPIAPAAPEETAEEQGVEQAPIREDVAWAEQASDSVAVSERTRQQWRFVDNTTGGTAVAETPAGAVLLADARSPGSVWLAGGLWLAAGLLGIFIAWQLLAACGIGSASWPTWLSYCTAPEVSGPATLAPSEETDLLNERLRGLGERLRAGRNACVATPAAAVETDQTRSEDVENRVLERGGTIGAVNITLAWESNADLDLHIRCPSGNSINYTAKSACGARLDVDANASINIQPHPVENIFWPEGAMAEGTYDIKVNKYAGRDDRGRPTRFVVEIRRQGELYRRYERTAIADGEMISIDQLQIPLSDAERPN